MSTLSPDQLPDTRKLLNFKSRLGTRLGGETQGHRNRYDRLAAKLGEFSGGEPSTTEVSLSPVERLLIKRAADFAIENTAVIENYVFDQMHLEARSDYGEQPYVLGGSDPFAETGPPRGMKVSDAERIASERASNIAVAASRLV